MDDDSTKVLKRSPLPGAAPTPPSVGPRGMPTPPPTKRVPMALRVAWGAFRVGVVGTGLVICAQMVADFSNLWLVSYGAALLLTLVLPVVALVWVKSLLKKRSPNARVKLAPLTWLFAWNLSLAGLLWAVMPGIGTQAIRVQGASLANSLDGQLGKPNGVSGAVLAISRGLSSATLAVEQAAFGSANVARRADAGQTSLEVSARPVAVDVSSQQGSVQVGSAQPGTGQPVSVQVGSTQPGSVQPGSVQPVAVAVSGATGDGSGVSVVIPGTLPAGASASTGDGTVQSGLTGVSPASSLAATPGTPAGVSSPGAGLSAMPGVSVSSVPQPLPQPMSVAAVPAQAGAQAEVPYYPMSAGTLVDVVWNRRYVGRMLLDPAFPYSTLDRLTLKRFGMLPASGAPTVSVETARGPMRDAVVLFDTLALGGIELGGVTVLQCDVCKGSEYVGILGKNVLEQFSVTADQAQNLLRIEDRHAQGNQRADIAPFVSLEAVPEVSSGPTQPFVVSATNRASRGVGQIFVRLVLVNADRQAVGAQDVRLPPLAAGGKVSQRIEVPRQPAFAFYQLELGEARW